MENGQTEAQWQLDEQRQDLATRLADLDAQRSVFEEHRRQWESGQTDAQRQLDEQRQELATRLANLDAQAPPLTSIVRQWETDQTEAQRQLDEQRQDSLLAPWRIWTPTRHRL